ncbi:MAG: hypothetical protein JXL80_10205, partial [Planctomycetes bacterium]|nr:hypothetical protein [Planctomycetota bacterium]
MFRRTMIILISVLAMVFLALLLHRLPQLNYERVVGLFKVEPKDVDKGSSGSMEVGEQGTSLAESDFEIIVRDPDTNRLRYVIRARKMAPEVGTTRTHLTEPDFYIYNNDGEIVNVKAPNGYFDTTGGPLDEYDDITRGRLTGGVVLRQDRGTPNDPGDDIVITMEHMDYARVATLDSLDDEGGEAMPADETPVSKLSTGDPVQVRSPEGDVDAVGMIVYLVRGKSDLRQLRLLTEVHIVLRTGSDKFQMGLVGDGSATGEPAESAGAATEAKSAAATSQTASGTAARPASGAATPSSGTGAAKRTGGQASGSTAGQGSGSGAAPVGAAAKGDASAGQPVDQNLMHFLMLKNVRINQGDRRLVGDRVTLLMPEESDSDKSSDSSRTTAPQTPPPTGSPGTTAPSATNGSRPAARTPSATTAPPARNGGGRPSAAPTTPSPGPSGDDASQEGDAAAVPVDIVCDGPFVLTPRQVREPPVKFHVTAAGSPVVLTDKDMEARGEYFQYDGTSKQGKLRGGAKQEATVIQNQSTVTGELFTFDQTAGTARVDGRGHLVGKASGGGLGLGGGASDEKNEEPFRARWDDWMSVSYMARDVTVDGETRNKSFLRVADFSGKAVLWQGEQTLAGDRIHAEFFLPTADGTQGLLRLTADGQVAARQPESKDSMALGDLACEHLDADFVRLPGGDSRIAAMHAKGQVRGAGRDKDLKAGDIEAEELWVTFMEDPKNPKALKAETMKAETDVRVRREGYYAESDYLEMKDGGERIELRGAGERLALVSSGTNKLRGKTIVAQQSANRADVTGQGSLNLLSNRGVEGEKLKEPMPLHITWSESMFFDGKANQAHFMGDAKARTPSASIDCRDLWVFFTDRPEKATGAGQEKDS